MKKICCILVCLITMVCIGCKTNQPPIKVNEQDNTRGELGDLLMKIDNTSVPILWEDNQSVAELLDYAKSGLVVNMTMYGNFEQVGSIGKTIYSADEQMTTAPGDVVLYSSNQIVIFFGSNSWRYTKLGHIDLSQAELNGLLNKDSVVLKFE